MSIFHRRGASPAYASGSNEPGQILGFAQAGVPFGVSASQCSARCMTALARAAELDARVFVDSGVFARGGARALDFGKALGVYGRIASLFGSRAMVVAPDVPGDAAATLALLRRYRDELTRLHSLGAEILVAVQDTRNPAAFWRGVVQLLPWAVPAWPSVPERQKGQSPETFYDFASGLPRIHLLGLGTKGRLFGVPRSRAIAQLPASVAVTSDANERARMVGRASGVRRLTAIEDSEKKAMIEADETSDEIEDSALVRRLAKLKHWEATDHPEVWWWAYIAGADPDATPAANASAGRAAIRRWPRVTPQTIKKLKAVGERWFAARLPWMNEYARDAFARDPIGTIRNLTGPDDDGEFADAFGAAYKELQARAVGQEIKRRGVLRVTQPPEAPMVVVGCGKSKGPQPAAAGHLYTGGVFCAHRHIADHMGGIDFVASAKHGLVRADKRLAPYDETLADKTAEERRAWAAEVAAAVCRAAGTGKHRRDVVALVGRAYAGWIPHVEACGVRVHQPLAGLSSGLRRKVARKIREGEAPPPWSASWKRWAAG